MNEDNRANPALTVVFLLAMAGMAIGVYTFLQWHGPQDSISDSSMNVGHVDFEQPSTPAAAAPETESAAPSGLNMLRTQDGGGSRFRPAGSGNTAQNFTEAVRHNEGRFAALAQRYTKRFPVVREYGRDWMKYPDLRQYNDDYFRDHDPIKFARNVASSPNFGALVRKYARRPEMVAFVEDAVKIAPKELTDSVQNYLKIDANATQLLQRFAAALGLPSIWVAAMTGKQNIDSKQVVNDVVKSNPQLQNLMQSGNLDPNQINSQLQGRQK